MVVVVGTERGLFESVHAPGIVQFQPVELQHGLADIGHPGEVLRHQRTP